MDSIEEAKKNFEKLGFYSIKHTPYKAPLNDASEIKRLEEQLKKEGIFPKEHAILEYKLSMQTKGVEEELEAFQAFDSFRGLKWESNERPYIQGNFYPGRGQYGLSFLARFPEIIEDAKFFHRNFGINYYGADKQDNLIKKLVRESRKGSEIKESVEISGVASKLIVPPYRLNVASVSLDEAYQDLMDTMHKLGFQEGKITKPRRQ